MSKHKPKQMSLEIEEHDGKFRCFYLPLPKHLKRRSWVNGDTSSEAYEGGKVAYEDYVAFENHLHGLCDPATCGRCKEGPFKEHRGIHAK